MGTSSPRFSPGALIADRFRIEAEAGIGGMGIVYRALDTTSGQRVALKVLLRDDEAIDATRFGRERSILAELGHPGIVAYVDHGRAGVPWLAMEWLEGETLAARLRRSRLGVGAAVRIVASAASALGAAHARGIVHRDIKPANLFLLEGDTARVKVLDFGIARRTADEGNTLTTTGTVLGTPYYMAPEQARGSRELDARIDVYALGCVLFEALTGTRLFDHESVVAVLAAVLLEEPPSPREREPAVPEALDALVLSMLSKRPELRPADGAAVAAALDAIALDASPSGSRASRPPAALTEREQRVVCVVLVEGAGAGPANARTLASSEGDDLAGRVRAAVEALSGSVVALADGSLVATALDSGTASDQAARAARCALAIREVAPSVAIAIAAGRAQLTGRVPVGEVVQRGADLIHAPTSSAPSASHAAIRLHPIVASLLDARFVVSRRGEDHFLDAQRVDTQRGSGARTGDDTDRSLPRGDLVGRDRELAQLEALHDEASSEPIARVALVTGPPGSGKTRLASEVLDRFVAKGACVLSVHADALTSTAPFALAARIVRAAAGIVDGEPLDARRGKLVTLAHRTVDAEHATRTAAMLGELCRAPFDDAADGALAGARRDPVLRGDLERRAFEDWLEGECRSSAVVLAIDDAQYADRASITLLDGALRHLSHRPLFLLVLARPEIESVFPELFADREPSRVILPRLLPRAAQRLVERALGPSADAATVTRIVEKGDGNPLYLEELARAVREGSTELPTSVLAMVEARLAVLDGQTRRVARAASVFGMRAPPAGVRALVGQHAIDDHLRALAQRDVLASDPRAREEPPWLAFRQPLVREAAYAMLTDDDRTLGHRLAGEWLADHAQLEPSVLAQHFELGGAHEVAARAWAQAADLALAGNDLEGALAHASRGLVHAKGDATRAALLTTAAHAHRWRAEYADAFTCAEAAMACTSEGSRTYFDAASTLLSAAARLGRSAELAPLRERLESLEPEASERASQIALLCRAASHDLAARDDASFMRRMARAEALYADLPREEPIALAWILTLRASHAYERGELGAFVSGTREAVHAYERGGDARDACNQRVRLANGLMSLGEPTLAEAELVLALSDAERMGLTLVVGYALQNLGHARALAGDADAEAALVRAIDIARAVNDVSLEAGARVYLADRALSSGDLATAEREARRAVAASASLGAFVGIARATLARALSATRDPHALIEARAARDAIAQDAPEGDALVALALAEALLASGEAHASQDVATDALTRVHTRAARIESAALRAGYLTRVPEHARLAALAHPGQ